MLWGANFGPIHLITLVLAVGINVGLYFILKLVSDKTKIIVLGILSFSGIAAIIYNLVAWNSPLEYLPFHLCSLNALVLPFAVFSRSKVLNNLLLLWSLGALFALVLKNPTTVEYELLGGPFMFYYFPHVLEFGIPILMFALKLTKLRAKCVFTTVGITLGSVVIIHFINLWVNSYCIANEIVDWAGNIVQVNYMYTIGPEGLPLLTQFYNLIPHSFWYMIPAVLIVALYLGVIYLCQYFIAKKRAGKAVNE